MMTRDFTTEEQSLRGLFHGIILTVHGDTFVENGFRVGMARDISYTVLVNPTNDPVVCVGVRPNHRRPSEQSLIIPAIPDDDCWISMRGREYRFTIFEGLYTTDCAT